jgi:hypothetical protein
MASRASTRKARAAPGTTAGTHRRQYHPYTALYYLVIIRPVDRGPRCQHIPCRMRMRIRIRIRIRIRSARLRLPPARSRIRTRTSSQPQTSPRHHQPCTIKLARLSGVMAARHTPSLYSHCNNTNHTTLLLRRHPSVDHRRATRPMAFPQRPLHPADRLRTMITMNSRQITGQQQGYRGDQRANLMITAV